MMRGASEAPHLRWKIRRGEVPGARRRRRVTDEEFVRRAETIVARTAAWGSRITHKETKSAKRPGHHVRAVSSCCQDGEAVPVDLQGDRVYVLVIGWRLIKINLTCSHGQVQKAEVSGSAGIHLHLGNLW